MEYIIALDVYEVGSKIGHVLGGTSDVIIAETGSKDGRYIRLKILMSINKPLPCGKLIKMGSKAKMGRILV